ncbi:hypothetical protein Bca4012_053315 [Brassica carinata]
MRWVQQISLKPIVSIAASFVSTAGGSRVNLRRAITVAVAVTVTRGRRRLEERLVPDRTTSGPPLSSTTNGVARDSRRRGSENQEFSAPTMSAPATPYVSPPRQTSPLFSICAIKSGLHLTCPFTPTTSLPSAPTTPPSIAHAGPSTNMEAV